MRSNNDNLFDAIGTLVKWRKAILKVCAAALLGSVVVSLLLPVYYKSTTIFYAASPDLAKPEHLFGTSTKDMEYYGSDEDIDRLLTIAESDETIQFLIDSFDLYQHYDIDSSDAKAQYKIKEHFLDLYEVKKTKYDAIELSVEDKDKQLAARIANTARNRIDIASQKLIKESQQNLVTTFEKGIASKEQQQTILADSLARVRKQYGIYDLETQSELMATLVATAESDLAKDKAKLQALSEANSPKLRDSIIILKANIRGLEQQLTQLTSPDGNGNFNLKRFNDGLALVQMLTSVYKEASQAIGEDKQRFTQIKTSLQSNISAVHIIEPAAVPIVKSRPIRWIIVAASVIAAFIFSILGSLIAEAYKDVDWRANWQQWRTQS
ncbi:MAG: hypothetical protein KA974_05590 [Saprospiraceae bacterium]|nr:hypothetical protein [Saprospiraceae bacterium]MBP7699397.1 hypothetical protein [Saprospiraceae bacterium]